MPGCWASCCGGADHLVPGVVAGGAALVGCADLEARGGAAGRWTGFRSREPRVCPGAGPLAAVGLIISFLVSWLAVPLLSDVLISKHEAERPDGGPVFDRVSRGYARVLGLLL